ncbi:LON peptidase substrate-binding domain-containing protein [Maricaulis sp.]|uniref:LON peptidase substrate-binding domain-containing protein n=1 Tax=Maricaulis sp. TaxID=1486257 RepID=UPI003A924CAE
MTEIQTLPASLPLFPLAGCILLPGELLPLNVFEPRYLNMVDDARREGGHIGIIQPQASDTAGLVPGQPALHRVGTAGRIKSFAETRDGRYLLTLAGVSRFALTAEAEAQTPYRIGRVDYTRFTQDLVPRPALQGDRSRLIRLLGVWLAGENIQLDWTGLEHMPFEALIDRIAMLAPLPPHTRQDLLEAPGSAARAVMIEALVAGLIAARAGGRPQ